MQLHVFSRALLALSLFASLALAQTPDEIAAPQLRGSASVPAYAEYDKKVRASAGAHFESFPDGAVYTIEFEDGDAIDISASLLEPASPARTGHG